MTQINQGQQEAPLCSVEGGSQPHQARRSGTLFWFQGSPCFSSALPITDVITPLEDYLMTVCPSQMLQDYRDRELNEMRVSPQGVMDSVMGCRV